MTETAHGSAQERADGWRQRLDGREFTKVPRWTDPGQHDHAAAEYTTEIPGELRAALSTLADAAGTDPAAVLLAVHLRVLGAVSSERELLFGYHPAGDAVRSSESPTFVPYWFSLTDGTWRELVAAAAERLTEVLGHHATLGALSTTSMVGDAPEIVLDLSAPEAGQALPAGDTVLRVAVTADRTALRIGYRGDAVNARYVERLAGYYLRALRAATEDPGAPHDRQSLLAETELRTQLHTLGGERKALDHASFVEAFEERVRTHPDRTAATHGSRQWTYAELGERANQIASALRAEGLRDEDVVAVVLDRNLDWVAATLGVFKAGGVYLPVRPEFPAQRIGTQLDRSACRFAITEHGSSTTLDDAVRELDRPVRTLLAEELYAAGHGSADPRLPIAGEQLAYIYFTSGSTGAPKGAMCEHAGMLNHLLAKIDDMELGEHDVVSQTASQCFDISLWQVVAPLLVGGSVRIIDTDVLLDIDRFVDEVVESGVDVAQLVPSYFEVLTARLDAQPRPLGRLRSISVTGEALKLELVQRWFDSYPDIKLVNAYGATEVCDDTMHEVLSEVPERGLITVGRSLRNVNTYLLDEHLRLVPLGSPGEIAFSGVCVGRGYINDEERTQQAFVPDPYRPDTRMYRTGDFGRWLPEGRIEFLGRRDQQVKIRGYRIEIGEIENKLLAVPGVRDAAVVISGGADGNKILVAFYRGEADVKADTVKEALARSLPDYMVPTYCHRLDTLPLTENGKIDKKVLAGLAGTLGHAEGTYVAPSTPTERRLATGWAEVLNVPLERIGRQDNFFELGGTSLAAVRLVVKLDRFCSLKQLVQRPVLSELAAAIDAGTASEEAGQAAAGGLLQPLSGAPGALATLVCFPYAGGNAVNFQLLAKELEREGIAVYGVELPGHDFTGGAETLAEVDEIASAVHAEIRQRIDTPVLLWGHCAGAAHALATARLLERSGTGPHRVFFGAMMLDTVDGLNRESAEVTATGNQEITARLLTDSAYVQLDGLQPERSDLVGSAYRHDVCSTNRHLLDVRANPEAHRISAALDLVVADDDPTTARYRQRYEDWFLVSRSLRLHVLDEGGHYFARTRAAEVARLVLAACADLPVPQTV